MSQVAMFSPDMQVRVNSSDNLGNKKRLELREVVGGGVKNVVKEEEEEEGE